jgi:hypothetical protein
LNGPSNLGADQRSAVLKILRAIRRPDFKLSVMCDESLDTLPSLGGGCRIPQCRLDERTVKLIFCRFEV